MAVTAEPVEDAPVEGLVAITLDRPPVNALDLEHLQAIRACVERLACDPEVRGVVLTGRGPAFSAGVDTGALARSSPDERRRLFSVIDGMIAAILGLPVPLGVAVNGHALGGGFVLALTADVRYVAVGDVRLGLPEIARGVPFPRAAVEVVRRELDAAAIRRLAIAGEVIDPGEAAALGLVDGTVAGGDLLRHTSERVAQLAAYPAFAEVKRQFRAL